MDWMGTSPLYAHQRAKAPGRGVAVAVCSASACSPRTHTARSGSGQSRAKRSEHTPLSPDPCAGVTPASDTDRPLRRLMGRFAFPFAGVPGRRLFKLSQVRVCVCVCVCGLGLDLIGELTN